MRRLFLLVLPAIFACGGGGESAPLRKTIIDSRDTYDPRSMDPALSTDVPTGRVVSYLFDGLTRITPEAKVVPGLAKSWDVSPDGITYTFHLHSGVKFHDGRPLISKNVVASFQRVLDPGPVDGGDNDRPPAHRLVGCRRRDAVADNGHITSAAVILGREHPVAEFGQREHVGLTLRPHLLAIRGDRIEPDQQDAKHNDHACGGPLAPQRWLEPCGGGFGPDWISQHRAREQRKTAGHVDLLQ